MEKTQKVFKILSIDGGGIKGIYSSTILEKFEEKYNCHISDHFDMLCGTSTGGLIALALSLKVPAKTISQFYTEKGNLIFSKTIFSTLKQIFCGGKYKNNNLKKCLEDIFENKTIGESNNLLCIPAFNYTDGNTCVFKYDHKQGDLARDNKIKYVDIALATSAAPTYFPICEIDALNKQYIDGGLWANNPSLVGLMEALCHFVGKNKEYNSVQILSISSLDNHKGNPIIKKKNRSALNWNRDLLNPFFAGQAHFTHNCLILLQKHSDINIDYIRIPSVELNAKQLKQVGMDKTTKEGLKFMRGQGQSQADKWHNDNKIKEIFNNSKKSYHLNN
jgi:patatin-like phospholipase/acyl hydrolase